MPEEFLSRRKFGQYATHRPDVDAIVIGAILFEKFRSSIVCSALTELRDLQSRRTAFNLQKAWDILKQIAGGISFIHRQEEIHRDLKPRNSTYMPQFSKRLTSSTAFEG
jgi:hypothetical protein